MKYTSGKYTYGEPNIHGDFEHYPGANLSIGNFCSIGGGVNIYVGANHRTDWVTTYPFGIYIMIYLISLMGRDILQQKVM